MSDTVEVPIFNDVYKQINAFLSFSGIPPDGSSLKPKFYVYITSLTFMIFLEIVFLVSRFSAENFLELTALAPCIGQGTVTLLKFWPIVLKRHKMFQLIEYLEILFEEIGTDFNKKNLIVRETPTVQKYTRYYIILNWILISLYCFSTPLLMLYEYLTMGNLSFMMPFAILLPFSYDNWPIWILIYVFSVCNGFVCMLYSTTVDTLYFNLCSHVCCNFAVICKDVQELNPANAHTLNAIIKRHQHLLNIAGMLDDIFSFSNWSTAMIGGIHICILGFNIMTDELTELPLHLLFLFVVLVQIFFMSSFGENLIGKSLKVREAAYECDWINMKPKDQRMILLIMTRATKPERLTAYKFYEISYRSFSKIISTSWSYFTLLRTVYQPSSGVAHYE